jgi:hypothetical protein
LEDVDDLLLQDESPRETWATIKKEHLMRRELARFLRDRRNGIYTVDQEGATADEKETDIKLRSTRSPQQAVIELKIGEKPRSAADLRSALKTQLLKKYMAAEECRAGCLVVTISTNKTWLHPKTRKRMNFNGLISLLKEEAAQMASSLSGAARLMVKGIDLRPRLRTEREASQRSSLRNGRVVKSRKKPRKSASKTKRSEKKTRAGKRQKLLPQRRREK